MAFVEREVGADVALRTQAHVLRLSRASLSYHSHRPSAEEVALSIARRRSCACARWASLASAQDRTSATGHTASNEYPYLLRDLTRNYPNQVWGIDVTSIPLPTSWMYLVAVLDWRSRDVVSWERDDTLQLPFRLCAAQPALAQATPVI